MYQIESNREALVLTSETARLRIGFVTESVARVTMTGKRPFQQRTSLSVVANSWYRNYGAEEDDVEIRVATASVAVTVNRKTGAIRYFDGAGRLLVREPDRGGKWLTPVEVYRNRFSNNQAATTADGIDGVRVSAAESERVLDRHAFQAKLEFVFAGDEALFGLGSHEEGYGNLRGKSRELYQHNLKAVVPYFVSTRGYGILVDCYSLMTFHDDALGSYLWADVVDELDYYFIQGERFDDLTRGYHALTGRVPMPPKWFFGYAQSKERYVNAKELVDTAGEHRRRGVPLDLIVLDWKSWPDAGGWGQKSLDPVRFPAPKELTAELHAMGARLMVSIWPSMTGDGADRREMLENDLMLGNQSTYDAFQDEARRRYWEQANRGLFSNGIDAWWCDCTEPFESDWHGEVKPEPHERLPLNTGEAKRYLDPGYIGAFSLLHSRGICEGQRGVSQDKRVVNLTRSSFAGQHRYGTTTWSGDICATWETLRRSIPEGLNFCAAGEPYWTVDIGGFFIGNDPAHWFWRGDYNAGCRGLTDASAREPDPGDTGCTDLGYWELYTRWLEYAGLFADVPFARNGRAEGSLALRRTGHAVLRRDCPVYPTPLSVVAVYLLCRGPDEPQQLDDDARGCFGFSARPANPRFGRSIPVWARPDGLPGDEADVLRPEFRTDRRCCEEQAWYLPSGTAWYDFLTGTCFPAERQLRCPRRSR